MDEIINYKSIIKINKEDILNYKSSIENIDKLKEKNINILKNNDLKITELNNQ